MLCSFVWALVHSPDPAHVERGLDLAQSMLKHRDIDEQHLNDLVYLCAVVSCTLQAITAEPRAMYCCGFCSNTMLLAAAGSVSKRELSSC